MKKAFSIAIVMAITSMAMNVIFVSKSYAESAFEQLQGASDSSQQGADKANQGDEQGARSDAGSSFDGNSSDSAPAVDLRGKEGIVDPNDLKKYDPQ